MSERLVVIGGDAAGMSAASQARRLRPDPADLRIVVFEQGPVTSYAACGLPYVVGGEVDEFDRLVVRTPEEFAERDIEAFVRHEVTGVDTAARTVTVTGLDRGDERTESYDHLLIATGSVTLRPPVPGLDADGVHELRTIPDGRALDAAAGRARRAVVVGGGYIGLEVAEQLRRRGLGVTLVEGADQPMTTLDPDMASHVTDALERLGVEVRLGHQVERIDVDDGAARAVVTAEGWFPADLIVLGMGVRPAAGLAEAAGVPLGDAGGIVVDERQRTTVPGVWAAGDCVESHHRVSGRSVVVALGTHANKQGRVAGTNLGGGDATFDGVLGTAITRVGDLEVARTGLNEAEAADAGFDHVSATAAATSRAGYFPGAEDAVVKLVAERSSGRLLGGQVVGGDGAGKRIDTIATALWTSMSVRDLAGVDLSYAPPFSPVWDPVLLAAGRTVGALDG